MLYEEAQGFSPAPPATIAGILRMYKLFGFYLCSILALGCTHKTPQAQAQINPGLKHELDSILVSDQRYRELIMRAGTPAGVVAVAKELKIAPDQVNGYLVERMLTTDSANIWRVSQLIAAYGYPGKSLVGESTSEAAFYVIQHSNRIPRYLSLIKGAAEKRELPFPKYAMMLDRQLMAEGKDQLYGTQGVGFTVTDSVTGQQRYQKLIWPIQNPSTVNERRRRAGFEQTVEENAQRLDIPYQVFTLEQVRKMKQP